MSEGESKRGCFVKPFPLPIVVTGILNCGYSRQNQKNSRSGLCFNAGWQLQEDDSTRKEFNLFSWKILRWLIRRKRHSMEGWVKLLTPRLDIGKFTRTRPPRSAREAAGTTTQTYPEFSLASKSLLTGYPEFSCASKSLLTGLDFDRFCSIFGFIERLVHNFEDDNNSIHRWNQLEFNQSL